jgi:hypothetical protein
VANRADPGGLDDVVKALEGSGVPAFAIPEEPLLSAPSVADLMKACHGHLVSGEESLLTQEATGVVVARNERARRAYTPDDVRARLHERAQEIRDDAPVSEPAEAGLVKRALRRLHLAGGS